MICTTGQFTAIVRPPDKHGDEAPPHQIHDFFCYSSVNDKVMVDISYSDYIDNIASCVNDRQLAELNWRDTKNLQHPRRVTAMVLVDGKLASDLDDMETTQAEATTHNESTIYNVHNETTNMQINNPEPETPQVTTETAYINETYTVRQTPVGHNSIHTEENRMQSQQILFIYIVLAAILVFLLMRKNTKQ